jgi:hypothetical protein
LIRRTDVGFRELPDWLFPERMDDTDIQERANTVLEKRRPRFNLLNAPLSRSEVAGFATCAATTSSGPTPRKLGDFN